MLKWLKQIKCTKDEKLDSLFFEAQNKFFKILRYFDVNKQFYSYRIKDFRHALWSIRRDGGAFYIILLKPLSLEFLEKHQLKLYNEPNPHDNLPMYDEPVLKLKTVTAFANETFVNYKKKKLLLLLCKENHLFVLINSDLYYELIP